MATYKVEMHSPSLNLTEEVQPIATFAPDTLEDANRGAAQYQAHYNFIKRNGATDWQAIVTATS